MLKPRLKKIIVGSVVAMPLPYLQSNILVELLKKYEQLLIIGSFGSDELTCFDEAIEIMFIAGIQIKRRGCCLSEGQPYHCIWLHQRHPVLHYLIYLHLQKAKLSNKLVNFVLFYVQAEVAEGSIGSW